MVDALREARRVLAPRGLLLDLRPRPSPTRTIELAGRRRSIPIGRVDGCRALRDDRAADAAIRRLVDQRWLAPRRAVRFTFEVFWDTVDEMAEFIERTWRVDRIRPTYAEMESIHRARSAATDAPIRLRCARTMRLLVLEKRPRLHGPRSSGSARSRAGDGSTARGRRDPAAPTPR